MIRSTVLSATALVPASCADDPYSSPEWPKQFFARKKVGTSADYGIIKFNDRLDHVTVHGFDDDAVSCKEVAAALNFDACNETGGERCLNPYSCIALNQ